MECRGGSRESGRLRGQQGLRGLTVAAALGLGVLGTALDGAAADDPAARRRLAAAANETAARAEEMGSFGGTPFARVQPGYLEGRWPEARQVAQATLATIGEWRTLPRRRLLTALGVLARAQGDRAVARRSAREALKVGLTKEQVVRVYALETGGLGTYDMQSGFNPVTRTGKPISSALGYAQLLHANSTSELVRHGVLHSTAEAFSGKLASHRPPQIHVKPLS